MARATPRVLDRRALNRAMLARQMLLARETIAVVGAVERLVGMQAQAPHPPYLGLWSRVEGFAAEELSRRLLDREVVRVALQRSTLQLVSARDCLELRPVFQPVLTRGLQGGYGRRLAGLDVAALVAAGEELLAERALTFAELGPRLGARFPAHEPGALAYALRAHLPLVQVPPRGLWGQSGRSAHLPARAWLGARPAARRTVRDAVRRYLAAFGPATVADVQAWSGLTRLAEVLPAMRDLVRFSSEEGATLYDVPGAPLPSPDTPAPIRFLPEWDNLLVAYADRSRVLAPEHRRHVFTPNGLVPGTVLVDGFARGSWRVEASGRRAGGRATLRVQPFAGWTQRQRAAVEREGARLLAFVAPAAAALAVEIVGEAD